MNDNISIIPTHHDDEFEARLRGRLHSLAEHAPATVRQFDEVAVGPRHQQRGNRRRAAGIGATVAALVGAIGFTTVALNGAGSGGGSTPTEAVLLFVEAFENEDVLGMIDTIDPTEVPVVRSAVEQSTAEAKRAHVVGDGFSLDGIDGVDFDVADLTLSSEELASDLALVTATSGVLTTRFDPLEFPWGEALKAIVDDPKFTEESIVLDEVSQNLYVATVARDGRWYVSISYTVAEYVRQAAGADFPTAPSVIAQGFDSPEAAATALYERLAALDFDGMVATAAPGEGDALARYASLWLGGAADLAAQGHESGLNLTISSLGFSTTGEGPRRTVTADTFVVEGTLPAGAQSESGMPPLDPTLPTVVFSESGQGAVIIPAGQPIPESIEGLETQPDWPEGNYNYTNSLPNGTVIQPPTDTASQNSPLAVRVERADGCTTWTGEGGTAMFEQGLSAGGGAEQISKDVWKFCDGSSIGLASLLVIGGGGLAELPSLATVEIDGEWYISPLGTIAASVIDLLRVPEGGSAFDSQLGSLLYGTNRASMERFYVGSALTGVSPECAVLFESGTDGVITAVVAAPDFRLVSECAWGPLGQTADYTDVPPVPAQTDQGPVEPPASSAPARAVPATVLATPDTIASGETVPPVPESTVAPGG